MPYEKEEFEKAPSDRLGAVFSGLVLILLGITFYMASTGIIGWKEWWAYFLAGLGGIFLIDAAIRSVVPEYKRPVSGRVFVGLLLLAIGGFQILGIMTWWPLILVVFGVWLIFKGLTRR